MRRIARVICPRRTRRTSCFMSLKAFHIVFVVITTLMAFAVFGIELFNFIARRDWRYLALASMGLGTGIGLIIYGRFVLKKLKNISYL